MSKPESELLGILLIYNAPHSAAASLPFRQVQILQSDTEGSSQSPLAPRSPAVDGGRAEMADSNLIPLSGPTPGGRLRLKSNKTKKSSVAQWVATACDWSLTLTVVTDISGTRGSQSEFIYCPTWRIRYYEEFGS